MYLFQITQEMHKHELQRNWSIFCKTCHTWPLMGKSTLRDNSMQ